MEHTSVTPAEIVKAHFAHDDVLTLQEDRSEREHALRSATAYTMDSHDEVGLIVKLANGETVEVLSNMVELEGDFVELKGGYSIPVKAILKVEM